MEDTHKDNIRRRYELLSKPNLSRRDIEELEDVKETRALQLMKLAREKFEGSVDYRPNLITTKSYLRMSGVDPDEFARYMHTVVYGERQ